MLNAMEATNIYKAYLVRIWLIIKKISKAIVSAMPYENKKIRESRKSTVHIRDEVFKTNAEKHYHRPASKPAVEKQTLLKENKKKKGSKY